VSLSEPTDTDIEVPTGWIGGELLDFLELQRGVDLPTQERRTGHIPIYGSNGLLGHHDSSVSDGPGVITGRSGTIGKLFYVAGQYWPLNTSLYVKNFKGNLPRFVYYKLFEIGLEKFSTGTGVPTLNRNVAHKEFVAFPPLPEQQKIAAILTTVDDKLDLIARQIIATQTLKQGLMQTLFTRGAGTPDAQGRWHPHTEFQDAELGRIPAEWTQGNLHDLVTISYGKSPSDLPKLENGVPIYGTGGISGYTDVALCNGPSVILGRKGTIDKVQFSEAPFWAIDTTFYTVPKIEFDWRWLYFVLTSFNLRKLNEASGVPSLSRDSLDSLCIDIPRLCEQQEIAAILMSVDNKLFTLTTKKTHYQSLKRGLMQKLLTGQWRVQMPACGYNP
jgi:type I restriction enzyme, S subunit